MKFTMRFFLMMILALVSTHPVYGVNDGGCPSLKNKVLMDMAHTFPQSSNGPNIPAPMKLMHSVPFVMNQKPYEARVFDGSFFGDNAVGELIVSFPKGNKTICVYDVPNPSYDPLQAGVMSRQSLGLLEVSFDGTVDSKKITHIKEKYETSGDVPLIPDISNIEIYMDPNKGVAERQRDEGELNDYFRVYHALEKDNPELIEARCIVLDVIATRAKGLNLNTLHNEATGKIKNLLLLQRALLEKESQQISYYKFILKNVYGYSSKGIGVTEEGYPLTYNNNWSAEQEIYWKSTLSPFSDDSSQKLESEDEFFMHLERIFGNFPNLLRHQIHPAGEGIRTPQRTPDIKDGLLIETADIPGKGDPITEKNLMYAMDEHGHFYIGNTINHPDFTRGRPVISAGHVSIEKGKITEIDTSSGHYTPQIFHLNAAIKILNEKNVLHPQTTINVYVNHETRAHIIDNKKQGIMNNSENLNEMKNMAPYPSSSESFDPAFFPLIQSDVPVTLNHQYLQISLKDFGEYVSYNPKDWQKDLLGRLKNQPDSLLKKMIALSHHNDALKAILSIH